MPCSMIESDESNQATFIRARSISDFGLTKRDRISGLGARGLAAKFSCQSLNDDVESLNVEYSFELLCLQVFKDDAFTN